MFRNTLNRWESVNIEDIPVNIPVRLSILYYDYNTVVGVNNIPTTQECDLEEVDIKAMLNELPSEFSDMVRYRTYEISILYRLEKFSVKIYDKYKIKISYRRESDAGKHPFLDELVGLGEINVSDVQRSSLSTYLIIKINKVVS